MTTQSVSITPTFAMSGGPGKFSFANSGIDETKIDMTRMAILMWEIKCAFAASGAIKTAGDTVALTLTCDGTTT